MTRLIREIWSTGSRSPNNHRLSGVLLPGIVSTTFVLPSICLFVRWFVPTTDPLLDRHRLPHCKSADAFQSGYNGKIKGTPKCAVDLIKKAEPYQGADNPFWRLHQLDIADKHKLLVPVGVAHKGTTNSYSLADVLNAYPDATTINLFDMPTAEGIGIIVPKLTFPLEDGTEIYRIPARLRDNPLAQMNMNPEFSFDVAFGEVEVVEGEPIIPTLHRLIAFVEDFVKLFPPLFGQEFYW